MFHNQVGVAFMALVLAGYVWFAVDRPLVPKLATLALALGAFLLAVYAIDRLRARYGVELPDE